MKIIGGVLESILFLISIDRGRMTNDRRTICSVSRQWSSHIFSNSEQNLKFVILSNSLSKALYQNPTSFIKSNNITFCLLHAESFILTGNFTDNHKIFKLSS